MKFTHLNGHNPDSSSAKARAQKKALINQGEVKCEKCGVTRATFIKVSEKPAAYQCTDCYKNGNSEA